MCNTIKIWLYDLSGSSRDLYSSNLFQPTAWSLIIKDYFEWGKCECVDVQCNDILIIPPFQIILWSLEVKPSPGCCSAPKSQSVQYDKVWRCDGVDVQHQSKFAPMTFQGYPVPFSVQTLPYIYIKLLFKISQYNFTRYWNLSDSPVI